MSNLFRSLVFVPGNNPRFLEKAKSLPADIVCFDLEDSVPDKEKKKARVLIKNTLHSNKEKSILQMFLLEQTHQNQAWLKQILKRLYKKELMEL